MVFMKARNYTYSLLSAQIQYGHSSKILYRNKVDQSTILREGLQQEFPMEYEGKQAVELPPQFSYLTRLIRFIEWIRIDVLITFRCIVKLSKLHN